MFNKLCRTIGVPPMYCYLVVFILICVSVFLIRKYLFKHQEGLDINGKSIVYCHMNGCGHCEAFNPTWDQFMNGSKLPPLQYAKVEASEDPEFMDKVGVHGFPAVIAVDSDGTKIAEHDGPRTVEALNDFANQVASEE
mgnify:CR=1 FL=1